LAYPAALTSALCAAIAVDALASTGARRLSAYQFTAQVSLDDAASSPSHWI